MKKLYSLLLAFLITNVVQAQSIQELRDSIEAGNLNSQVDLALRYMMGDSLEQNEEEAIRLIRDAADRGNRYGQFWLGDRRDGSDEHFYKTKQKSEQSSGLF